MTKFLGKSYGGFYRRIKSELLMYKLLKTFSMEQNHIRTCGGDIEVFPITMGLHQGSTLSPSYLP